MRVALDPGLVALHSKRDRDSLRSHLQAVIDWNSDLAETGAELVLTSPGMEWLQSAGLFPMHHLVADLFQRLHFEEVSPNDATRLLLSLINRTAFIDDDAVVVARNFDCRLDDTVPSACDCHEDMNQVLADVWLHCAAFDAHPELEAVAALATMRESSGSSDPLRLGGEFAADVLVGDSESAWSGSYDLPFARSIKEMCRVISAGALGRDHGEWKLAISASAVTDLGATLQPSRIEMTDQFRRDLADPEVSRHETRLLAVLRASAEVVLLRAQHKTHALRLSSGGGSPQVERDGWKAWRHELGNGWRIHYWRGESGRTRLATVHNHDNFEIPDP